MSEANDLKEAFQNDLNVFVKSTEDCLNSVLVFPCINSYSRLQLHEVTKETFPDLTSFSVGTEPDRRPIICRQQLIANWALKGAPVNVPQEPPRPNKKTNKRPEMALYVPKALRGNQEVKPQPPLVSVIKTWEDEVQVITGPVKMLPPLTDYLAFEAGCYSSSDLAFRRVVELGDFPKELKTSDLETVLHSGLVKIKEYYDLRWVDDHHALVIFSDEVTASRALRIQDPQIKFRPFYEACEASKLKAKTFGLEDENRQRPRPNTSTVMARRLLSRALNNPELKANPKEEQELREAKKNKSK